MENAKKRVLLVEDSQKIQSEVRAAIGDSCNLTCASSVNDADSELRKGIYSLLLLEVSLPDRDRLRRLAAPAGKCSCPVNLSPGTHRSSTGQGCSAVVFAEMGATGRDPAAAILIFWGPMNLSSSTPAARPTDRFRARTDRKSTRLNSSHTDISRMPSSA